MSTTGTLDSGPNATQRGSSRADHVTARDVTNCYDHIAFMYTSELVESASGYCCWCVWWNRRGFLHTTVIRSHNKASLWLRERLMWRGWSCEQGMWVFETGLVAFILDSTLCMELIIYVSTRVCIIDLWLVVSFKSLMWINPAFFMSFPWQQSEARSLTTCSHKSAIFLSRAYCCS